MVRWLALVSVLLGGAAGARAAELQVVPVLLELSRAEPRAFVTLRNTARTPVRLELSVSAWDQTRDGQMRLAPAPEFVVFPPLLVLAPNAERKVRISTTAPFGTAEKPFRLTIQELPQAETPREANTIRVLTRVSVPVFLLPPKAELRAEIQQPTIAGGHLTFVLKNLGTTRLSPGQVRVDGKGADGSAVFSSKLDCWYLLAGGERAFDFAIPAGDCGRVRAAVIEAPLGDGMVSARVETPGGACGP